VATRLVVTQSQKTDDDSEPIEIIRDDGAIGSRVSPAEDRVEDTPSSAAIDFWVAALWTLALD
jgi:hypothetical protein